MQTHTNLEGKKALITGGSRGLGLAIGKRFASLGAEVAFTYSKSDWDAEDAVNQIGAEGRKPLVFKGSVSDSTHVRDTVGALIRQWGGIDILVNNAGITQILPIALIDEEDWDNVMDVNLKGVYLFSRAVLRHMIKAQTGAILNIGSFASERFVESPVHYAASKSALRGFTEALALEVGRHQIRINLLSPGLLDVGLGTMIPQHRVDEFIDQTSLGRKGTVAEIATLAAYLVSDENSFMTGAKIVADGGL